MGENRGKSELLGAYLPFWERLRETQRDNITNNTRAVRYRKGSHIADVGEDCGMVIVRRGRICAYTVSEQGREVALLSCYSGDICLMAAHSFIDTSSFNICIAAETEVDALIVDTSTLSDICKSCIHAESFMRQLISSHFCRVTGSMQNMLLQSPEQRLADYLCAASDRTGSNRVNTTHEQLAKHIGTAREVGSRTLKRLSAEGVVSLERGTVVIKDKSRLRQPDGL